MTALFAVAGTCWLSGATVCVEGMIRRRSYGTVAVAFVLFCAGLYAFLTAVVQ